MDDVKKGTQLLEVGVGVEVGVGGGVGGMLCV